MLELGSDAQGGVFLMGMQRLGMAAVAVAMLGLTTPSQATPLTGDTVTVDINSGQITRTPTVVAGTDLVLGLSSWDFDAGLNGDTFVLSQSIPTPYAANPPPAALTIELSDLDFLSGEILVGFLDLFSAFPNTTFSITDHSILFSMEESALPAGVLLSGRFVTRAVAVPEPASLALFGVGLAGLGALGWRRRKSRQNASC